jgi:hypothetical protein
MKTTDLFKINRTSKRLNESMFKTFGRKLNLETFNVEQLEDARNKLRTQIYTARSSSSFNENVENDALSQAQFMHDAIVAELAERDETIVDNTVQEGADINRQELMMILKRFDEDMNEIGGYGDPDFEKILAALSQGDVESAVQEVYGNYGDQDGGEIRSNDFDNYIEDLEDQFKDMVGGADEGLAAEAAKYRDAKYKDQLYTQEPPDYTYGPDYDDAYDNPKPDDYAGRKRKIGGGEFDHNDPLRRGQGIGRSGIKHNILDRGPRKGLPNRNQIGSLKGSIKAARGTHNRPRLPEADTSRTQGESMSNLREGEIQQASAIVTAKTMVDRVGRWIEELSGMENDTLLQLGDSIRDEMGQEQAKGFIEAVAPAIQSALENLKTTREALASGVRTLTGEEQPANMLGGEPAADMAAEPDAMNTDAELGGDEFAAAEPAAGGAEEAGREMRESINHQNRLMRALAG